MIATQSHALYRFYSDSGQLLYVGITNNPGNRFSQHETDKPWWHEVAVISVEKHESRADALAAEVRAINVESPRYNKQRPRLGKRHAVRTAPRPALVWLCDVCGQPVDNDKGYIHVDTARARQKGREYAELKKRVQQKCGSEGFTVWSGADLMDIPNPLRWEVHHRSCDPNIDRDDYWIDVSRARTHAHLLSWTAHLMHKRWAEWTAWDDFIRKAAGVNA